MPSLWKKQRGNRITQLVADLQTPSKRGGSLVVETGFPTSLIDLFVKHRNKLKKPKTKKHKSKKVTTISEVVDDDVVDPLVSHPPCVSCEFDGPTCPIVDNFQEKVDNFEEIVVNNDLLVEKNVAHETQINHDCGKIEEVLEGSNSKNMVFLLSILMEALFLGVELYAKKWVLALITLGVLLMLLFEYLGIIDVCLLKPCENGVLNWGLKGGLVVVLALYTKWFVVGVTIGASLLILLEYTGNSIFGFFKPCQDAKEKLLGILANWCDFNKERSEVLNDGVNDLVSKRDVDQECVVIGVVSSREMELDCENGLISKRGVENNGEGIDFKGDNALCNDNSMLVEEVKKVKPICELLALESIDSKCPKSLEGEKGDNGRREEGDKDGKLVGSNRECKKNKKFWKRLVSKKKNSMIKKHDNEGEISVVQSDSIHENSTKLVEEEEDEQEICEEGLFTSRSTSSSSLNDECEGEIGKFEPKNVCIPEILQLDKNINTKPCGMVKEGYGNLKCLTAIVIPLTGLIGGRMLGVVVTVICCIVIKLVRS